MVIQEGNYHTLQYQDFRVVSSFLKEGKKKKKHHKNKAWYVFSV